MSGRWSCCSCCNWAICCLSCSCVIFFFRAMNQGSVRDLQIFGTIWGFLNIRGMGFMRTRIATEKKQLFILLVRVGWWTRSCDLVYLWQLHMYWSMIFMCIIIYIYIDWGCSLLCNSQQKGLLTKQGTLKFSWFIIIFCVFTWQLWRPHSDAQKVGSAQWCETLLW